MNAAPQEREGSETSGARDPQGADQVGAKSLALAPGHQVAASLAEHAVEIRRLHKRRVDDLVEIGRRLTECQKLVQHGDWLDWLDAEFGWSHRSALNFMRVYGLASKSENFSDLNLPISALYLLAAPSTPAGARDEIVERAKAGEAIKIGEVKKAISARKQPAQANNSGTKCSREGEPFKTATTAGPKPAPAAGKLNNTGAAQWTSCHHNILAVWNNASLEERTEAIGSIGLEPLLAAIPDAWWPLLEKRVAECQRASASRGSTPADDDDLAIPECLRRSRPVETGGAA
jgi:Protein of unknown function (DUF3102)